jgi:gamma-glutamyltranspeptidase / glutathione hydrolase
MIRSRLIVTKQTPLAPRGMVVAEHWRGAAVGATILERGGNAIDAAVATAIAMTVIEPFMSTVAGSGTMLVHLAKKGETVALNFNGIAPLAAHDGIYRIASGVSDGLFAWPRTQDSANEYGHLAVAVPGSLAGLALAVEKYGTMEWRDIVAPAIKLARDGFEVDWYLAQNQAKAAEDLQAFPETARTYLRQSKWVHRPAGMQAGDTMIYADLARSLELIAKEGAAALYKGALGQALVDDMKASGGLIRSEDLAAYRVLVEPALMMRYRDTDLAFSPGSTGGPTAVEIMNILAEFPSSRVGWSTVEGLHVRASAIARAFRDRFEHLGDPAMVKVPWERLLSREYARGVAAEIRRGKPAMRRGPRAADECTTHVGAIDKQRNMVALTNTAVSLWGSRVVVPGTGILLNNGMIWFNPEAGKANSVASGKRGLVNMVPVLGFKRGQPSFTLGAPGGRGIVSGIPQVVSNLVDLKASPQAAIEAPRVHTEGAEVLVSTRVGDKALAGLARKGHTVVPKEESYSSLNFSRPIAIRVTPRGLEAGCEQYCAAAAAGH